MRNLCVDIGNTFCKVGIFENGQSQFFEPRFEIAGLKDFLQDQNFDQIAVCSVKKNEAEIQTIFEHWIAKLLIFDAKVPLPIHNNYGTPQTLGVDRLAAAVGAAQCFPQQACLIIDAGTCIKYDIVSNNAFEGGMIAPGMSMRYKAMHEFTAKLPLIEVATIQNWPSWIGKSTAEAMQSGVQNGIVAEMTGVISQFEADLTNFKIILTGGDAIFFESRLKRPTFVIPNLVLIGLDSILNFNYGVRTIA